MNIIFVLIPLSLVLLGLAVWAFFWAVRSRQFENLEVEAWRILMDDEAPSQRPSLPAAETAAEEAATEEAATEEAATEEAAAGKAPDDDGRAR